MRWLVAISLLWLSDLGYFGPSNTIDLAVEETAVRVGTLRLALEGSATDTPEQGVGTLNLELEDSVIRVGTLRLELESSPPRAGYRPAGTLGLELE